MPPLTRSSGGATCTWAETALRLASPRSRLLRLGILDETKANLEYVLALKPADLMERRLQTQVFKLGLAKSIHHARVLIRAPARADSPPEARECCCGQGGCWGWGCGWIVWAGAGRWAVGGGLRLPHALPGREAGSAG